MEIPQQQAGAHGQDESGSPPLSPASAVAAARWNPTKEQVAVLEGLYYEHGLRSPSAEQIQQIADRLREHGHGAIEGKSVFYWFQNHRARLRQRQDSFAYFTKLLRRPPPLPVLSSMPPAPPYRHGRVPPPPPPAACYNNGSARVMYMNPFCMTAPQPPPANAAAYYYPHQQQVTVMYQQQQYPRMEVGHGQDKTMPPAATFQQAAAPHGAASTTTTPLQVLHLPPPANGARGPADQRVGPSRDRETLQLFPLQPTFAQLRRDKGNAAAGTGSSASLTSSTSTAVASASISEEAVNLELESAKSSGGEAPALPFYDFFGLQSAGGR